MRTGTSPIPTRGDQDTHVATLPNETYQASTAIMTTGGVTLVSAETTFTDQLRWVQLTTGRSTVLADSSDWSVLLAKRRSSFGFAGIGYRTDVAVSPIACFENRFTALDRGFVLATQPSTVTPCRR